MPTDNRLKYIDSQIAELGSQGLVDAVVDNGMEGFRRFGESEGFRRFGESEGFRRFGEGFRRFGESEGFRRFGEGFEGGVHLGRARTMFVVFAAVIMILYVLDE